MMNAADIKLQASGNWPSIVFSLAPHLAPAIEKTGKHVPCPVHGGKDGLRLYKDFPETGGGICNTCGSFSDGLALLSWANGWSFRDAFHAVHEYLTGCTRNAGECARKRCAQQGQKSNEGHQQRIDNMLSQAVRINWPIAKYLNNRGLGDLAGRVPKDLKAVESLPYWHDGKQLGLFPAMVGIVRNLAGDVVNLHRTYLNANGYKANVPEPKKLMSPKLQGSTAGCAIQLYKPTNQLAITEGIETALAVHLGTDLPVWAAISSTMLEKVQVPPSVREIIIMADKDVSGAGERSANILAGRLSCNHIVKVVLPKEPIPAGHKSIDWLDVYLSSQAPNTSSAEVA